MLCDADRWQVSYYFVCQRFVLSHARWLEYSFQFDNSADYSEWSLSFTRQDLYVKNTTVLSESQSGFSNRDECPWRFTRFAQNWCLMTPRSLLLCMKSCLLQLIIIKGCLLCFSFILLSFSLLYTFLYMLRVLKVRKDRVRTDRSSSLQHCSLDALSVAPPLIHNLRPCSLFGTYKLIEHSRSVVVSSAGSDVFRLTNQRRLGIQEGALKETGA